MARLSAEEEKALAELVAKRDAPDEGDEIWVRDGDREYRLRGSHASKAYARLFGGEDQGDAPAGRPAKKAAKKAAPRPVDDEDQDDEDQDDEDQDDEQDPPTNARTPGRFHRALGFSS